MNSKNEAEEACSECVVDSDDESADVVTVWGPDPDWVTENQKRKK